METDKLQPQDVWYYRQHIVQVSTALLEEKEFGTRTDCQSYGEPPRAHNQNRSDQKFEILLQRQCVIPGAQLHCV